MRNRMPGLWIYLAGVFIGALDTGVLGPAFPLIAHGFHISLQWAAWTVTVYTVCYAASTVLCGALGDRFGRRGVFTWGVVAFGAASLLAVFSGAFWVFLCARAVQGAGAGAVYPNAQAEGVRRFPLERRGMALGIFGAIFGLATIVGPNVGGALAQYFGWRAIFLLNVPITLLVLAAVPRLQESPRSERAVPDWIGGLCFAGVLATALLAIALPGVLRLPAAVAALLLLLLLLRRQRGAAQPFLDTRPFRGLGGLPLIGGAALIGLAMSSSVFVPTLAQQVLHFSVLGSGVALMPAAFSGAVLAGAAGVLVDRSGARVVLQVGLAVGVVGGVLLAWPRLSVLLFVLAMLAMGAAMAFTMGAPINRLALALYRDEQAGEALSVVAVFRSVGMAAGPVLLTLLQAHLGFPGMFGGVAVACVLGLGLFFLVPDARPLARRSGPGLGVEPRSAG